MGRAVLTWDEAPAPPKRGKATLNWDEPKPASAASLTWETSVSALDKSIPPPEQIPAPTVDPSATTVQEMPFAGPPKFKPEPTIPAHRGMAQLTGTQPPPGPEALQPLIQPVLRAGAGAAAGLGELGATLGNLVASSGNPAAMAMTFMGQGPIHFSGREFIREAERTGVLTEANFLERTAQFTGEGAIDIGALAAGASALQAAGFLPAVANSVSAIGTGMLASLSQAGAERRPFSVKDAAQGAAFMAASMPVGHAIGSRIVAAAEEMAGKPLGKAMQQAIQNSAMATVFQAQDFASGDPLWKERWLAAGLSFNITSAHEAMFPGETRPRTAASAKRTVDATVELLNERGVGVSNQAPVEVARAEAKGDPTAAEVKVRQAQAQAAAENAQVPFSSLGALKEAVDRGSQPEAKTPAHLAADFEARFGISAAEATKIANRKVTAAERAEIEAARTDEAVMWESRRRGGEAVALEAAYQRALLSDEQTATYETQRQSMPEEVRAELEAAVPTPEEAIAAAQEHATAMNAPEPAPQAQPEPNAVREALIGPPKQEPSVTGFGEFLGGAAKAISNNFKQMILDSIQSTGKIPRGERNGPLGKAIMAAQAAGVKIDIESLGSIIESVYGPPKSVPAEPVLAVKTKAGVVKSRVGAKSYEDVLRTYDLAPSDVASYGTAENRGTKVAYREEPGAGPTPPDVAHPEGKAAADEVLAAPVVEPPSFGINQLGSAARRAKARAARPVVEPPALTDVENAHLDQLTEAQNAATRFGYKSALTAKDRSNLRASGDLVHLGKGRWELTTQGRDALSALENKYVAWDRAREQAPPAAETAPLPVQSILDRAIGKAHEALGAAADVSPQVVTPEVRAKYERALTAAQDKAAKARAALKKTGLSDDELKMLGVGALTLGAYIGQKAADDDKTRDAWSAAVGIPAILLMGKGRKLSAGVRAEAKHAIEQAKIRDAREQREATQTANDMERLLRGPMSRLISFGIPGKINADELGVKLMAAAAKVEPQPEQSTPWISDTYRQTWKVATEHMGKLGVAATGLARLVRDAHSETRRMQGKAEYDYAHMDTGIYGDNPIHQPSAKEARALNRVMDWQVDRTLPKPEAEIQTLVNGSAKIQREHAVAMLRTKNVMAPETVADAAEKNRVAQLNVEWHDADYVNWLKAGQEAGMELQPLYSDNGHFYPHVRRPEVYHPPASMRWNPLTRAKYFELKAEADRLQEAIARDSGVSPKAVRRALEFQREWGPSLWKRRPLESLSAPIPPEMHRVFRSPIGIEWSPSAQHAKYTSSLAERIQHVRHFGYEGYMAKALIELGVKEGVKRETLTELFDTATGQNNGTISMFGKAVRTGVGATKPVLFWGSLGRMVQGQFSQMLAPSMSVGANPLESQRMTWQKGPEAVGGAIASSSLPKWVREKWGRDMPYLIASNAGVLTRSIHLQELARSKSPFAWATAMEIKLQGGSLMDRAARISGATLGNGWFKITHDRLLAAVRSGDVKERDNIRQYMEEIFREEPIYVENAQRTDLKPQEIEFLADKAAQFISDRWNHDIAPSTMPLMYSDPVGSIMFALGTFNYKQTKTFTRVMHDFAKYPAARKRIALAVVPLTGAGMATTLIRNLGSDFDENGPWWQFVLDSAAYAWFGPVFVNTAQVWSGKYGNPVKATMGPLVGMGLDFGDAVWQSERQDTLRPLGAFATKRLVPKHPIPFVPQPRDLLLEELGIGGKKKKKRKLSSLQ